MMSAWKWRHAEGMLAVIAHDGDLLRSFLLTLTDQLLSCNTTSLPRYGVEVSGQQTFLALIHQILSSTKPDLQPLGFTK